MYGQGHLWVVVTIAAAIVLNWFVFGNLIKKKKRSSPTPIVNNNPAASTSASTTPSCNHPRYELWDRRGASQVDSRQQQNICGQRKWYPAQMKISRGARKLVRTSRGAMPSNQKKKTSASASAATLVGEYEVFLSFRGADTRDGFTDYLYNDLIGAGVCTFRDDNELRVGEEIGPDLLRAIKQSKISIPIFSKTYASSKWCLREFAQMVECRKIGEQVIYPIFYDVEPSEVQHYERGSYKVAFLQHDKDKKLDEETVQQWKKALEIVGDLKGWELKKITSGRQGELVKIVVEEVLSKLKKNYKHVPKILVGMDGHIKEMEKLINIDFKGVRIIGILGMGGLGKTTIATVIYNQVCELFECHCFIEDVRENSNSNGIVKLQERLVSQILKRESKFHDVHQGIDKIKGAIHRKKVLIVLDDVDKKFQIDELVGNHSWYGAGSRIIITTRNEDALLALERTCQNEALYEIYRCYRPNLMDDNLALELFSKYAFMADSPPDEDYDALAMEVVSYAGGLPLVLMTLGSLLFIEKDKVSWQEKLRKLQALPSLEVLGRLRISYDALDNAQQQIFLDIGCLLCGLDKTYPCYMWDDCEYYPWEGINALVRRSLIIVKGDNILWMHDQLRELAEQIICEKYCDEPGKWSRLWRSEDAWNILKMHLEGTFTDVKLLRLGPPLDVEEFEGFDKRRRRLGRPIFRKLPNLRYLSIICDLDGDFKNLLQNLRWLQWSNIPGNCAPTNLHMKNLVVLELEWCDVRDGWGGWSQIKMSNKLKVLGVYLCCFLTRIPHLSAFPTLERLELIACTSLCRLDGLDELESLKYLYASSCTALKSLPDLSKLTRLQTLKVQSCEKLTEIQGLVKLESLEDLDMSSCCALKRLPNLSNLRKLTRFASSRCEKLVEIQGLERLASLEDLNIEGCKSLKSLPDLSNFKKLRILKCGGLNLTEVQALHVPESLEYFFMNDLHHIKRLPDMSNLRLLKILLISSCYELFEIQDLDGLESLETLNMFDCRSLERLPDLSNLKKLKYLDISACSMLLEIQCLDRLESLEHLEMHNSRLKVLPDLPNFGILKHIGLSNCLELQDVKTLQAVESLESLNLSSCRALEILGLEELKSLELLNVCRCESIKNLPDLSNLTNLKKLDVSYCVKLTELRGLEELKSLTRLRIVGCESLKNLPCLPNTKIQCDSEDKEE